MTLKELKIGESAVIDTVGGTGELRQHFLDMGLIPGEKVTLVKFAPMGDPMELQIHGYELTLRLDDAARIEITPAEAPAAAPARKAGRMVEHPGLGEGGRYHTKKGEHPLPEGTVLTFALAGNQNCGKTTLFNQLTGSNQHVGNFPGVTVDRKSGAIREYPDTEVTDLPGIYSMSPYSSEGDRDPAVHHWRKAHGHHQHRGCHQHRAQPVLNDAADGAGHPHGAGTEYDG